MAHEITKEIMEEWMKYTDCEGVETDAYGTVPLEQIDKKEPNEEYQQFARLLIRSIARNAVEKMNETNMPTSVLKLAFSIDYEIEREDDPNRAIVKLSCCGGSCDDCAQPLTIIKAT